MSITIKQKPGAYFAGDNQTRLQAYVDSLSDTSVTNFTTLVMYLLDIAEGKAQPSIQPVKQSKEYLDMVDKYETDLHIMGRRLFEAESALTAIEEDAIEELSDKQTQPVKQAAKKPQPTTVKQRQTPAPKQSDKSDKGKKTIKEDEDDGLSFAW